MNKIILCGRLTRDPELRYTKSGKSYVRGTIAVDRQFQKDQTDFIYFTAWGKTAENLAVYTGKGSRVIIEGRLQQNSYEKDGRDVETFEVVVDNANFIDFKKRDDASAPPDDDDPGVPF